MFSINVFASASQSCTKWVFSEGLDWIDDIFLMFIELVKKNHRNWGAATVCLSTADLNH